MVRRDKTITFDTRVSDAMRKPEFKCVRTLLDRSGLRADTTIGEVIDSIAQTVEEDAPREYSERVRLLAPPRQCG